MSDTITLPVSVVQVMAQVVAAGSERGLFRPNELAVVGNAYNVIVTELEKANTVPQNVEETAEKGDSDD